MRRSTDFRWLMVGLLFAGLLYGVGWAVAARSPAPIRECVNETTGASRTVAADGRCASGEALFTGTK